ncbi:MAG: UDP-2,3-diacylglucosamine diphosphatase [Steroidobacteraceae bacterium]
MLLESGQAHAPHSAALTHLFVSDLHLDAHHAAAARQFIAFVERDAQTATSLYILGDLFESWVGDDDPDACAAQIIAALADLARCGVPCFIMHGNRDFLLASDFANRSGCIALADPSLTELHGRKLLISHGDLLCTDDLPYQELRTLVRGRQWQREFLRLPLTHRLALAGAARKGSKEHTGATQPQIMDVNDAAVAQAFRVSGADILIHGHTHRPGIHEHRVDGRLCTRIVLGSWYDEGSYLRWDESGYRLCTLPRID